MAEKFTDDEDIKISRVDLEKLSFKMNLALSKDFIGSVLFREPYNYEALEEYIIGQFKAYVWAEKEKVKSYTVKYPRDWWQAFKERWFPSWAKEIWPVKYEGVIIDVRAIYPDFKPAVDDRTFRLMLGYTSIKDSLTNQNEPAKMS